MQVLLVESGFWGLATELELNKVRRNQKQQPYLQFFFLAAKAMRTWREMFELVICRRQVVRGGEDTKLLLDGCKQRFGSLCELESFVSVPLFTFRVFFRAGPNVHYSAHRQRHPHNLKGTANWPTHGAKIAKYGLFKAKAGKIKDRYSTAEVQESSAVSLSSPKPSGWKKWQFSCQTALLHCCELEPKTGQEKRQLHWLYWPPAATMTEQN